MCDSSKLPKKKKVFANDAQINIYTVNGQFSFQTQMDLTGRIFPYKELIWDKSL